MTQLTLNIKDNQIGFFLSLISNFDFVQIEKNDNNIELSENQMSILDKRLENYKSHPESYKDWGEVKKDIEKRYGL